MSFDERLAPGIAPFVGCDTSKRIPKEHAVLYADLVLLATIKVCAESYPHITVGRIMELSAQYGELISFDDNGAPVLKDDEAVLASLELDSSINDLSLDEGRLLDALAALGDNAKVSSKELAGVFNRNPTKIKIGSIAVGKMLGSLENRGYVTRVREKPSALWRALEDSRGNPPPSHGGAA